MDPGSTPVHRSDMHNYTGEGCGEGCAWDLLLQNSCHTHSYSVVAVGFDYQVCCGFVVGSLYGGPEVHT